MEGEDRTACTYCRMACKTHFASTTNMKVLLVIVIRASLNSLETGAVWPIVGYLYAYPIAG